jgi:hypothetical protein
LADGADPSGEGSVIEKVITALCLAFVLWAALFSGPMAGNGGRLSGDAGKVARLVILSDANRTRHNGL